MPRGWGGRGLESAPTWPGRPCPYNDHGRLAGAQPVVPSAAQPHQPTIAGCQPEGGDDAIGIAAGGGHALVAGHGA